MKNIKKISLKIISVLAIVWPDQAFGMFRRCTARVMPQTVKNSFKITSFYPNNQKHYQQVLSMLTNEKEMLLDPNENPDQTLQNYVKGMKTPTYDAQNPYSGLSLRTTLAFDKNNPEKNDVAGFSTFTTDQYKVSLRTLAINPNYRGQGLAKELLQDVEQQAKERNLDLIAMCIYSHNTAMLKLTEKLGYKPYWIDPTPSFQKVNLQTGERTNVYTGVYTKKL